MVLEAASHASSSNIDSVLRGRRTDGRTRRYGNATHVPSHRNHYFLLDIAKVLGGGGVKWTESVWANYKGCGWEIDADRFQTALDSSQLESCQSAQYEHGVL